LVEGDSGSFLIELSPDIRLQSTRFNLPLIKDFLVSHWHFDHLYGIMELHAWAEFVMHNGINIFCSNETKDWIDKSFGYIPKNIISIQPYKRFDLYGITVTPIPVYHMRGVDDVIKEDKLDNVFGYVIEKEGKRVVYLADYYKIPQRTFELIKGADIIIADGTYLFEDLFPNKVTQNELKNDSDHLHGKDILTLMSTLNAKEIIFHSITHLSEKDHSNLQTLLPQGFKISYDGMVLL
jgi:phosphoribosyl 1,2-cyclic phosphodiesterase